MAAVGASPQVVGLLVAYSLGLGIPFLLVALAVDRAPLITRPLLRYSRYIEIAGGRLIIFLGLALIFDWLGWFAQQFAWLDFSTWIEIADLTRVADGHPHRAGSDRSSGRSRCATWSSSPSCSWSTAGLLVLLTTPISGPAQPRRREPRLGLLPDRRADHGSRGRPAGARAGGPGRGEERCRCSTSTAIRQPRSAARQAPSG